jgi:multifunctional methyltransferase subunit TRM112
MKLLTHNMLQCNIKGVQNGYPFKIEAAQVEEREMDFDADFLKHIFPRIQWDALHEGAVSLGE